MNYIQCNLYKRGLYNWGTSISGEISSIFVHCHTNEPLLTGEVGDLNFPRVIIPYKMTSINGGNRQILT